MAGAGFKTFGVGDVLTASDVNTYLMQQAVMNFASSGARGSAIGTAVLAEGMVSYLADTDTVEVYDGSAWTTVGTDPNPGIGSNVVDGSITSLVSTTSTTDVTTLSITPSTATSKVLVLASGIYKTASQNIVPRFTITDSSNTVLYRGDAASNRIRATSGLTVPNVTSAEDLTPGFLSVVFLHSPATTSAYTYKLRVTSTGGATTYVGSSASDDADSVFTVRVPTSFVAIEVAA